MFSQTLISFRNSFFIVTLSILSFFLSLNNSFGLTNSSYFSDLNDQHKDFAAIEYLAEQDVIEGYPNVSNENSKAEYRPDTQINRAEFSKIVVETKFSDEKIQEIKDQYAASESKFSDVLSDAWYSPYVAFMAENNYLKGYPDGTLRPSNKINTVEALAIISRVYSLNAEETQDPWWKGIVEKASELNIIPLDITSADLLITRGQMAQMIYRTEAQQNGELNEKLGDKINFRVTYQTLTEGTNVYAQYQNQCLGFASCEEENLNNNSNNEDSLDFDEVDSEDGNNEPDESDNSLGDETLETQNSPTDLVKNIQATETDEGVLVTWDGVGQAFFDENNYQGYKVFYAKKPLEQYKAEFFYYYKVNKANSAVISAFGEEGEPLEIGSEYYFYVGLFNEDEGTESQWSGGNKVLITKNYSN